jgi:cysteine-rich repeat protein
VDTDGCTTLCELAECGDGFVQAGEECDDGNDNDVDACRNDCTSAVCGDHFVSTDAGEECDDGNTDDTDDCASNCLDARCGDGSVHAGVELCDDGNGDPDDGCEDDCTPTLVGIDMGTRSTCVWTRSGKVKCWGDGSGGCNGYANTDVIGDDETPSSAGFVDLGATVTEVSSGYDHVCALSTSGTVHCWGDGFSGVLGYANTAVIGDDEVPSSAGAVDVGAAASSVVAGGNTCALVTGGNVRCWGDGGSGMNGHANTITIGDDEVPATAGDIDVGGTVVQLASAEVYDCALLDTGAVRCWGYNWEDELGYGNQNTIGDDETPASAGDVDIGGTVTQIAAGARHTCVILTGGAVRCWGNNGYGRLGYGTASEYPVTTKPSDLGDVDVGGPVVQLALGDFHTCALLEGGAVRCWGDGGFGALGYGNTNNIGDDETPASAGDVPLGGPAVRIAASRWGTCALMEDGGVRCWGSESDGELGYGSAQQLLIGDDETPASVGDVPVF